MEPTNGIAYLAKWARGVDEKQGSRGRMADQAVYVGYYCKRFVGQSIFDGSITSRIRRDNF
jgi:hypothetical protein